MTLPEHEVLSANIVVLARQDAAIGISSDEITSILKDAQVQFTPGPLGQQAAQLTSLREQAVITVFGNRLIFQDQSGARLPKAQLAVIASRFIELLRDRVSFSAYGFNFDIAFDSKGDAPAAQAVMDRFIRADRLTERGLHNVRGAGLQLYYESSGAKCDLRVEPFENRVEAARFFAHINYHYELGEGQNIPDVATLRSDFSGKFQTFIDDLEGLLIA